MNAILLQYFAFDSKKPARNFSFAGFLNAAVLVFLGLQLKLGILH
jgi:hypothetical protein